MPERPRSQPGGALGTEHGTVNMLKYIKVLECIIILRKENVTKARLSVPFKSAKWQVMVLSVD